MKIAIISRGIPDAKYPLNGIFEFDQARALKNAGNDVAVFAIDFRSISYKRKYGFFEYDKEGVKVYELSLPLGVYRRALPILQFLLLRLFKKALKSFGKPDIIHAHFYSIAAIASILKKKFKIPFIVTEHSSQLTKPASQISSLDKKIATKAYKECDNLICVSKTLSNNILHNFNHRSVVVPDMVDDRIYSYIGQNKELSPFVYVSVGNLVPIKAFDILIEAFAKVKDNANLLIVGDGPEKEKLQNIIKKLDLDAQVKLLGQLDRVKINEIYQKSHVFVLASQSETFGVSYVEAMYAGLPVIATRCGGPESFVDESNGLLVAVNDADALANAMLSIRNNYSNYNSIKISEDNKKRFSPEVIAVKIVEIYNKTKVL